ncbi:MAG TPA: hypothetical protein VFZ47_00635, partial [Chitinophagaceae bacterium]
MGKYLTLVSIFIICLIISCQQSPRQQDSTIQEEENGYDNPEEAYKLEFEKTKDPALGYVPSERLQYAEAYTINAKKNNPVRTDALIWEARGSIYDSVGPNGNTRGNPSYTSGRIRAVMIDTLNDPTGNTVFVGGVAGGLWKCTNFLSPIPNWISIADNFDNVGISSICQDPSNPAVMYFATGEATNNSDVQRGRGVYKSANGGTTWSLLPSTNAFVSSFKILCDNAGNVYLATKPSFISLPQPNGLFRSKNGGGTWENITPTGLLNQACNDIEFSTTGKLHAAFGYGTPAKYHFTGDPANVTVSNWSSGVGIRGPGSPDAFRMELATLADTLYAVTVATASNNVDSCYKSLDGGATWTRQNNAPFVDIGAQGWYNLTLAISPFNSHEVVIGTIDAMRSVNDGATGTIMTHWAVLSPYVHADHHFVQWWRVGTESRMVIACDGGIFLSRDGGITWNDRNRNLNIKQFYSCAIHPAAGSSYLIGGTQDNGTHQLKNPGLTYSIEVMGGDGCFVHINQQNPQIQFVSTQFGSCYRSTNGGQIWNPAPSQGGLFINPFDFDDAQNFMYSCRGSNRINRWSTSLNTAEILTSSFFEFPTAFKVSSYVSNRLFIGSGSGPAGALIRLENANTVTDANINANITNIKGALFPSGFLNCINTGTSDNHLVVVFSNYGINNVWYSGDAGASWSAIDGNLPDMPVRWAVFVPGSDSKLIIATEAGVYTTNQINGAATIWTPSAGFPTVRTTMLKVRQSDNTIVAATYGRGLFTAIIPVAAFPVTLTDFRGSLKGNNITLHWQT